MEEIGKALLVGMTILVITLIVILVSGMKTSTPIVMGEEYVVEKRLTRKSLTTEVVGNYTKLFESEAYFLVVSKEKDTFDIQVPYNIFINYPPGKEVSGEKLSQLRPLK